MKLHQYNDIIDFINNNYKKSTTLKQILIQTFEKFDNKTLGSIYSQECQKRIKRIHARQTTPEKMNELYFQFCEEFQKRTYPHVMLNMASKIGLQPALFARIILDRHLAYTVFDGESPPKSELSKLMKSPFLIEDPLIANEIEICLISDDVYGPTASTINQSIGHEYEFKLKDELERAGISFQSEEILRQRGYDKTPDTILEIPIAVEGHVVCWIESKASFGDPSNHANYLKEQYWSYWNRFGSGLVIYWFGFVEELNSNQQRGILLYDKFPEQFQILNPDI